MNKSGSALAWTAFCYVADELSPAERESFEAQLETDQSAREAVAEAVSLAGLVAAAEAGRARTSLPACPAAATSWWGWAGALTLAGSAALALLWLGAGPSETIPARMHLAMTPELAYQWVTVVDQFPAAEPLLPADELSELEGAESAGPAPPTLTAPSWMLAAVGSLEEDAETLEN